MTKYRIVKKPKYEYIWFVQKLGLFGWADIFHADEDACNKYLDNIKKYGWPGEIIREEII